jgi:hypothetical protein
MFSLDASRMKKYVMLQFVPFERYSHTPTLVKLYGIYEWTILFNQVDENDNLVMIILKSEKSLLKTVGNSWMTACYSNFK